MTLFRRCPLRPRTVLPGQSQTLSWCPSGGLPCVLVQRWQLWRDGEQGCTWAVSAVGASGRAMDWLAERPQQRHKSKRDSPQGRAPTGASRWDGEFQTGTYQLQILVKQPDITSVLTDSVSTIFLLFVILFMFMLLWK